MREDIGYENGGYENRGCENRGYENRPRGRRLLSAAAAAAATALGLALSMGSAGAQDLGLQQLRDSAVSTLASLNMDTTTVQYLTLEELAQLQSIGSSGDSTVERQRRAETVLRNADERIAAGDIETPTGPPGDIAAEDFTALATLEASATQYFARIGMTNEVDVESLTLNQLMQIQSIQAGGDSVADQKQRVERVIAE